MKISNAGSRSNFSIDKYLQENSVALEITKSDKIDNLRDMLLVLAENNKILLEDVQDLHKYLIERERWGSTGLGSGVALPHTQHPCVTDVFIAIGRSINGINWESLDGKPTHLIFLVIGPKFGTGNFLRSLAHITQFLKNQAIRERLLSCKLENIFDMISLII